MIFLNLKQFLYNVEYFVPYISQNSIEIDGAFTLIEGVQVQLVDVERIRILVAGRPLCTNFICSFINP